MSYYIDPWLYNCSANPADSPTQQMEQRTIVAATNRALDYAYKHGVTLIAAVGQRAHGPGPPDGRRRRARTTRRGRRTPGTSTTRARIVPTEGHHVISVGAVGPTTMKADYSNWGVEQTQVTAPGGYFRDGFGTPHLPDEREPGPLGLPAVARDRERAAESRRLAEHADRRPQLPGQHLRVLPVPPGDVDGVAARGRRRGADRQRVGPSRRRQEVRTAHDEAEGSGEDPRADGHGSRVPESADDRLHARRPGPGRSTRRAPARPTSTRSGARASSMLWPR